MKPRGSFVVRVYPVGLAVTVTVLVAVGMGIRGAIRALSGRRTR